MSRRVEDPEWACLRLIGRRIRVCRLSAGLSQEELAARAGVHRVTVNNIERGDHGAGVLTYLRLSRPLGVWMGALLDEELPAAPSSGAADRAGGLPS